MKPEKPSPTEKPRIVKLTDSKPAESKTENAPEPKPAGSELETATEANQQLASPRIAESDVSSIVDDEIIRARARKLLGEQPPQSKWQRLSTSPLTPIILGFILTGLLGGFLTHYYSLKQKELELQRAEEQRKSDRIHEDQRRESDRIREDQRRESDQALEEQRRESDHLYQEGQKQIEYLRALQQKQIELLHEKRLKELEYSRSLQLQNLENQQSDISEQDRMRLPKIAEVWGKLNETELRIDGLLDRVGRTPDGLERQRDSKNVHDLVMAQKDIIKQNEFWLGPEIYNQVKEYHNANSEYAVERILGKPEDYLTEVRNKRERAKQNILEIRKRMLLEKGATHAESSVKPSQ